MIFGVRALSPILLLCLSVLPAAADGTLNIHFIDVGYGDAILIEPPDSEPVLIDAGGAQYASRLSEYFSSQNITSIDAVILTHPHENHFGGLLSLVDYFPVKRFFNNGDDERADQGYNDVIEFIHETEIPTAVLREGDQLSLNDSELQLTVLHPSRLAGGANENALVLWLVYKETSFLLASDIQPHEQRALTARHPQIAAADVIQVPHHGGTIDDRFAAFFKEQAVFVVSTGANKYGKPLEEELNKWHGKILRTDRDGTIVFRSDGRHITVNHD